MRISFPTQINLFLGAGILCLAFIGFISYFSVADFADAARLGTHTQEVLVNIQEVESIGQDLESSYRGFLLTGNEEEMQALRELQGKLFREVFHLRALTVDSPRQRERLDALEQALRHEIEALETAAALRLAQGAEAAVRVYPDSIRMARNTAPLLGEIRAEENRLLTERRAATQARQQAVTELIVAGSVTAIVLVCWSVVVINRYRRQRTRAEEEVARARERLELSLEGSSLALWDVDVPSGRVYLDERWSQMLGGPRRETVTSVRELTEQTHREERHKLLKLAFDAAAGRISEYHVEHRVRARNAEWRWILSHGKVVERDPSGRALRMAGTNADITERKRVEAALRASEAQLRLVTDHVPAMIAYLDDHELCRFANRPYAELFGRAVPEVVGRHLRIIAGRELYQSIAPHVAHALAGEVVRYERSHPAPGGQARDLEVALVPHRGPVGEVQGVYVMISDITERRAVERMKSEFVSVVSHELRTPLTSIAGALALVNGGAAGELPAEAKPLLDIAVRNAERLTLLVNDILDLEKIEAGMMRFEPRELDLAGLVRESLDANQTYALKFGVSFELEPLPAGIAVNADPDRLMQLMANLLSNAAKFSPPGGRVEVSLSRSGNRARVSVRDHGSGMSEAFQQRVFQRFAQEDTTDAGRKGGTGLGLAICKAVVERSGGHIGFDSRPGEGTTFWFELPAASA